MNPATINTILNSAPAIIQGASRLIKMIRERGQPAADTTATPDAMSPAIDRIESRLDAMDESNVEQIKLIEQLAKQNEALAATLQKALLRLNVLGWVSLFALGFALLALAFLINQ